MTLHLFSPPTPPIALQSIFRDAVFTKHPPQITCAAHPFSLIRRWMVAVATYDGCTALSLWSP